MRKFIFIFIIICLSACVQYDVDRYEFIDLTDKSMTVPVGSKGLKGKLKKALIDDAWKLAVYKGATVTTGAVGANTNAQTYEKFLTKYRLRVSSKMVDLCFPSFTPLLDYDISVINNNNGMEAFTMSGRACRAHIPKEFIKQLNLTEEDVDEDF